MPDEFDLDEMSLAYRYGLTKRQERFVLEYLVDLNASQAAKRAGYSTASTCAGSQIMSRSNVRQAIDDELESRSRQYRAETDRIIQELAALGFAQIADFVTIDGQSVTWEDMSKVSRFKRAAVKRVKHTTHYGRGGEAVGETVELELEPKLKALELLGKHIGMFRGVTPDTNRGAFAKWAEEQRHDQAEADELVGATDNGDDERGDDDGATE